MNMCTGATKLGQATMLFINTKKRSGSHPGAHQLNQVNLMR